MCVLVFKNFIWAQIKTNTHILENVLTYKYVFFFYWRKLQNVFVSLRLMMTVLQHVSVEPSFELFLDASITAHKLTKKKKIIDHI